MREKSHTLVGVCPRPSFVRTLRGTVQCSTSFLYTTILSTALEVNKPQLTRVKVEVHRFFSEVSQFGGLSPLQNAS